MFWVTLFTGDGSKMDKSKSQEIKVSEVWEQGTGSRVRVREAIF